MRRFACMIALSAAAALAQDGGGFGNVFVKAPPHIEDALRAKVQSFYDLHLQGKFRQADALVHEDSKDVFFEAEKVRMRGFKLVNINYEDGYNRAKVVVDLDTEFYFVGFGKMDVHRPLTSTWKRDDQGNWWWYVEKSNTRETPFNTMTPGPKTEGKAPGESDLSKLMDAQGMKVRDLLNKVTVDKKSIELLSHAPSSGEFTIKNNFEGPIDLFMQADDFEGVVFNLETTRVEAGAEVKLKVNSRPKFTAKKPDLRVLLRAEPIGKTLTLMVNFAYPPNTDAAPGAVIGPKAK